MEFLALHLYIIAAMGSFAPGTPAPAVLHGAHPLLAAEALGEVAQGGKAQDLGDLGQGVVGFGQEEAALLDAAGDEVADGRGVELLAEGMGEVVFIDVHQPGQLFQGEVFLEVVGIL